ncbi:kinase-like domain-containing protein [Mycena amicta]|nr:kinase-like domain-containing protein [Mycena amicta]
MSTPAQVNRQVNSHLWGYLLPLGSKRGLLRIDFWGFAPIARLGRDPLNNTLILPGLFVSGQHAEITWNGEPGSLSRIELRDLSSNGTWVGERHIHNETCELYDGAVIGFGAPLVVEDEECPHDYRYLFVDVSVKLSRPIMVDDLYVPQNYLGKGTYGSVTQGYERKTGKVVAVKYIKYGQSHSDIFSELSAMERINHPHVMKMLSFHHGMPGSCNFFIAMEYLDGMDLYKYMTNERDNRKLWPNGPVGRGIPQDICRDIMYQLCHALAHLHMLGITHRDLKPENIMLRASDLNAPFIVLADFGLAHVQRNMDEEVCLTETVGSWTYMAPEVEDFQFAGYDHYSDSFSAGIILFSMLILTSPWCEPRVEDADKLPKLYWAGITRELLNRQGRDLLRLLLSMDPDDRISATGALTHPWLAKHEAVYTIEDEYKKGYLF